MIKHLKTLDFATEAQEFRITTIDGKVSFPVGCFFSSSKGGSQKIKEFDNVSQVIESCKECLIKSTECQISCDECGQDGKVCEECETFDYERVDALFRKCRRCQLLNLNQGRRKDGRGNEPVGSCAMCDARSTGPRALEGKNR